MISFNATFIIQVLNFLLLMWILNRILFKPILKSLEEREEAVKQLEKSREGLISRSQCIKDQYGARMREAQSQAAEAKEGILLECVEETGRIIEGVSREAEKGLSETRTAITRDAERARRGFEELGKEISLLIYHKIIGN